MSSVSAWYYETRSKERGQHLSQVLRATNPTSSTYDATGMEMGRLAQDATQRLLLGKKGAAADAYHHAWKLSPRDGGLELANQLLATGEPQIMIIQSFSAGHALVAYGYHEGRFLIYDPNYPGETVTYAFDPKAGFGKFERANGQSLEPVYAAMRFRASLSVSSFASDVDFAKLFDTALEDGARGTPLHVVVDDPALEAAGTVHLARSSTVLSIRGRVVGGSASLALLYGSDKKMAHPRIVLVINYGARVINTDAKLDEKGETPFAASVKLEDIQSDIRKKEGTKKGSTVDHFTVSVFLSTPKVNKSDCDSESLQGRPLAAFNVSLDEPSSPPAAAGIIKTLGDRTR